MAEVGSAFVSIIPSAKGFGKKLGQQVEPETKKTGSKLGSSLGKAFAIAGGAAAAVGFVKGAIGEAREAQKVGALTAAVIKSTGGAAKITATQVEQMAGRLSALSGIDDETIQSGENMLLTFRNIRNEVGGKFTGTFDQATKASLDMSAALGTDMKSAALQVGKALNDPVKGLTKLGRSGVTFTEQQKKQVAQMVKNNNVTGAQAIILGELNKEFGGAAKAQATAGDKAKVAFQNLQETVGTALLPVLDKLFNWFSTKIAPAISTFVTGMQKGTGAGGKFADILQRVGSVVSTVGGFLLQHKTAIAGVVVGFLILNGVMAAHAIALTIAETGFLGYLATTKLGAAAVRAFAAVQWLMNAALTANPIGIVVVAIAALVTGLVIAYKKSETFRNIVNGAFKAVVAGGKFLWGALKGYFKFIINAFLTVVGALIHGAAKAFGWVPGVGGKLKALDKNFQRFRDNVNKSLNGVNSDHAVGEVNKLRNALDNVRDKKVTVTTMFVNKGRPAGGGASGLPGQANGTNFWRGGPTWVGERGPEIVNLPRGSQVIPNHKIGSGGGGRQAITITNWREGTGYIETVADGRVTAYAGVGNEAFRAKRGRR